MESFSVLTFKNISDAISLYRTVEFGKLSEKQIIGQHLNKLNHTLKSMLSLWVWVHGHWNINYSKELTFLLFFTIPLLGVFLKDTHKRKPFKANFDF